uniref:Uncharacterized protein n=1 Tax=Rhizophora mucronata TaxID=61149 RepID=A0A2P2N2L7_RHIMU
MLFIQEGLCTL